MCRDYMKALRARLYCDYLPSLNGDVLCLYEPVKCRSPPRIEYGYKRTNFYRYSIDDTVRYSCAWGYTILEGNDFVRCQFNGQ